MAEIVFHPKTTADVARYLESPSQVLAIIGGEGSGASDVAFLAAAELLGVDKQKISGHYKLIHIQKTSAKQEIPIEEVRTLIKQLRVKVPGDEAIKRVVLIENGQLLSLEAQNALLKTLEQPNPDTVFIITLDSAGGILPTVLSRAVKLIVHPITLSQALAGYEQFKEADVKTAWNISEGASKLLYELLSDEESELKLAIDRAKVFISKDKYNRLIQIDELAKDRAQLVVFLEALAKVVRALHHSQIRKDKTEAGKRLLSSRKLISAAKEAVLSNASAKLALLNLIESLEV